MALPSDSLGAINQVRHYAEGRLLAAHALGLSLPSAMPLDEAFVEAIASMSADLGGFRWFSEHLSLFITPKGTVPNAQAGLGLPVVYDEEAFAIVSAKLHRLRQVLGCPLLLENGSFFTPVPDMEMSEPAFLNRLYAEGYCGVLLDLHDLYVTWRNGGISPDVYLKELNLDAIEEIHLAGGDDFGGFYMDSHSGAVPAPVWEYAFESVPRFRRLRALTFEFQETYYERLRTARLVGVMQNIQQCPRLGQVLTRLVEMPVASGVTSRCPRGISPISGVRSR